MKDNTAIVIGGGFYGALIALMLRQRGREVILIEKEPMLLGRASERNQARVHGGYHYPRSLMTAFRSRVNYPRFIDDFQDCIHGSFEHIYAIARRFSKVGARQFKNFMDRIGSPLTPLSRRSRGLLSSVMVEHAWTAEEATFNAATLRQIVQERLRKANVDVRLSTVALAVRKDGAQVRVQTLSDGKSLEFCASHVFDCTYASLNRLRSEANWSIIPLKHELAEMCLVEIPQALQNVGFTVMCGPFFSLIPYPARESLYTLSHVRYTPHLAWDETVSVPRLDPANLARATGRESAFPFMLRDASRFVPAISECRYVDSIWEIKTVLPQNEGDDGRPILFNPAPECPRFISVMGGKLDNIYDVPNEIDTMAA